MASGSQTYSGICADLPVAPTRSSSPAAVIQPTSDSTGIGFIAANTVEKSSDLKCTPIRKIARAKPKSPMRLTMNALLPASVANFSRK